MSDLFFIKAGKNVQGEPMTIPEIRKYISSLNEFVISIEFKKMCNPDDRAKKSLLIIDEIMRWQSHLITLLD